MYGRNLDGQPRKNTINPFAQQSICLSHCFSDQSHHHQSQARPTDSTVFNARNPTPSRERKLRRLQNVYSEKPMEHNIIRVDPPNSQQQKLRQNTIGIHSTKITENKSSFVQSTPNKNQQIKRFFQAYDEYGQKQCLPILEDSLDQEMPSVKMTIKKNNHIGPTTCPENNTEQESNVNPKLFDSIHTSSVIELVVKQTILEVFQNIVEQMQLEFNEEFSAHRDNNKNKDYYKENNSNCEPPKKKRGSERTFVLPPEYDPHDSRWTLKHQAIRPGLVELLPNSNIYVSERRLAKCKRVAKGYRTFGRMLLVEIFSQNALSVCSLTSATTSVSNDEADIRPGLDKKAISTLLTYVENYARRQGWGEFISDPLVDSLKSKIYDMRSKYVF